jgi:hypothetical protein
MVSCSYDGPCHPSIFAQVRQRNFAVLPTPWKLGRHIQSHCGRTKNAPHIAVPDSRTQQLVRH